MAEIIDIAKRNELTENGTQNGLAELTGALLADARASIQNNTALSVPIAELSTLGAGVSSLIPAFHTVTQTTTVATDGLYRIANAEVGDTLKIAKDGNAWGSLKTATGKSKMMKITQADPLSATTQSVAAFNPATMMMAAALYSIEKDLSQIAETQKKILTFLEVEKESQIEADVESLTEIVTNYKYNWDNERSMASSHKFCVDIKNRARKNMIVYQKQILDVVSAKRLIPVQKKANLALFDLEKKFKYYRLSLYTFALSSLMEVMLSGNFKEEYVSAIKDEIEAQSELYRKSFEEASVYLEKLGNARVEKNVVKGLGIAGEAVGKFIGSIPLVEKGPVDELLQEQGNKLQQNASKMERESVQAFAVLGNPDTRILLEKIEDVIQIYNHTSQIYFDREKIYLLV